MRFAEYDQDGDQKLDFEEFYAMQPQRLKDRYTVDEVRVMFNKADANSDGTLSINEFFMWTMSNNVAQFGASALKEMLSKYDGNGSGKLDAIEFEQMAVENGFGAAAAKIFSELDDDGSGTISYHELIDALSGGNGTKKRAQRSSMEAQQLLASSLWAAGNADDDRKPIDTRKWRITARDVAGVRKEMQELIAASGVAVADVLRLFNNDAGSDMLIDTMEFYHGLRNHFSYKGNAFLIQDVFSSIDRDGSGHIGFDELFEFVRGKRHSLDRRSKEVPKRMPIVPPIGVTNLAEIAWDVETLRVQIADVLASHEVTAAPLLRTWDRGGDGRLSEEEFVERVRNTFFGEPETLELWETELKDVCEQAFKVCAGRPEAGPGGKRQRQVNAVELQRWLTRHSSMDPDKPPLKAVAVPKPKKKRAPLPPPAVRPLARAPAPAAPVELGGEDGGDEADQLPAPLSPVNVEDALRDAAPVEPARALWQIPTSKGQIPPISALPPLTPRSYVARPGVRGRAKPIFHPIRPLSLPHAPVSSPLPPTMRVTAALGDGSDATLAAAEKGYAQLCVLQETELTDQSVSPRQVRERRRKLHRNSGKLCREYNQMGIACMARNPEMAYALLQRARTCAATADDGGLTIATLANIGLCWLHRSNPCTAAIALRLALKLDTVQPCGAAESAPADVDVRVKLRLNLSTALCQLSVYDEALAHAEAAVAIATAHCDEVQLAIALYNVCVCREYLGQLPRAQAVAERALALARANVPAGDVLLQRLEDAARALASKNDGSATVR